LKDAVAAVTVTPAIENAPAAAPPEAISWSNVRSTVVSVAALADVTVGAGTGALSPPGVCAAK
jgi:deoxyhypusine synthase